MGADDLPDITQTLKRYITRVRRVQRAVRKYFRIQQARVVALMSHFYAAEFISEVEKTKKSIKERAHKSKTTKKGSTQKYSHGSREHHQGEIHSPKQLGAASRVMSQTDKKQPARRESVKGNRPSIIAGDGKRATFVASLVAHHEHHHDHHHRHHQHHHHQEAGHTFVQDFKGEELLPDYIRLHVLQWHVRLMQHSLPKRLAAWRKHLKETQMEQDLSYMGFGDKSAWSVPRPRALELDRLKELYAESYDKWLRGGFRHVVHSRKRLLGNFFSIWRRMYKTGANYDEVHHRKSSIAMHRPPHAHAGPGRSSFVRVHRDSLVGERRQSLTLNHPPESSHRPSVISRGKTKQNMWVDTSLRS